MEKLAENLVQLRKERNLSQEAVAKKINIGARAYQNYEYGQRVPPLSVAIALADLFEISLDELVGRER